MIRFSLFQAFKALTGAVVDLARESLNSITGNAFAEASPPTCDDEDGARGDGYEIASDDGDTVYWCFGRDDGGRYLRIVNNRRYALLLDYSAGLSVLEQSQVAGEFVERLSQALTLDHQVSVFPRDEVTLRVEPDAGATATVSTQFDGVGSALTQLWVGANTLFAILNRFGAGPPAGSSEAWRRLIGLLDNVDCLDVVGTGNPGSIIAACFDLDALRDTFGLAGAAILAPVAFTGSLASFFQSQLNALGDQLDHRDRYTISISAPAGPVAADGTVELRDQGLGPLTIGMTLADAQATGWVGDELTSCSERLFGEPEGGEQNFALNGPNAPATLAANGVFFAGVLAEIDAWGGVSVGGVLELNDDLDPYDAADTLSSAGYTTEVTTIFEPDDYLNATEADGDTLSMFFQDGPAAGLPQLTTCD